jgi:hypothetical protein
MPRLRCYDPSVGGGGGIHGWYNGLSPGFRAQVDAVLELLALEDDLDAVPEVKAMRGACVGLTEIEIDFYVEQQKVCLRILGFIVPIVTISRFLRDLSGAKTPQPLMGSIARRHSNESRE